MRILIIGGGGFVSSTMARHGLGVGHEVWSVSRGNKPLPDGARPIVADRKDTTAFASAIEAARGGAPWDMVIDCIGFNAADARQDVACFAGKAKQLVFISTEMTCSPINRPWKIDETFDRFDTAPYGANKRAAEELLMAAHADGSVGGCAVTILRPNHIYGPGSLLGCLPHHGRDKDLIAKLRRGETLRLLAGGTFLQQPVFVRDLAATAYSAIGNARCAGEIYFAPGPEVIESKAFYRIIADILGVSLTVEEALVAEYLKTNPDARGFCCHRVYSTDKARLHGLTTPATPMIEGLREHVASLEA